MGRNGNILVKNRGLLVVSSSKTGRTFCIQVYGHFSKNKTTVPTSMLHGQWFVMCHSPVEFCATVHHHQCQQWTGSRRRLITPKATWHDLCKGNTASHSLPYFLPPSPFLFLCQKGFSSLPSMLAEFHLCGRAMDRSFSQLRSR